MKTLSQYFESKDVWHTFSVSNQHKAKVTSAMRKAGITPEGVTTIGSKTEVAVHPDSYDAVRPIMQQVEAVYLGTKEQPHLISTTQAPPKEAKKPAPRKKKEKESPLQGKMF